MNNEHTESDLQKANMLNNFFTSQTIVDDSNKALPDIIQSEYALNSIETSSQDVKDILMLLNIYKACGPDLLSPRLLKEGATALEEPLSMLFNRSLEKCDFPVTWKDANVSPVYKQNDKSLPSNYIPISLLSSIGKAMERYVHKHLYNYVIDNDLITPLQSGFKHGDSTNVQLIHTYHSFCAAVASGKEVRAVLCDASKVKR